MSTLKELSNKIKSVKSAQKTVKVMQMVSTVKFNRARVEYSMLDSFKHGISQIKQTIASDPFLNEIMKSIANNAHKENKVLYIVYSADRGLCGGFNSLGVNFAVQSIFEKLKNSDYVDIFCIGSKGSKLLQKKFENIKQVRFLGTLQSSQKSSAGSPIKKIVECSAPLLSYKSIDVAFSMYHNISSSTWGNSCVWPINFSDVVGSKENNAVSSVDCDLELLIKKFILEKIKLSFSEAYLSQIVSEHQARMMAMEGAFSNTKKLCGHLSLLYNRTRQNVITKELVEIISGAESIG